MKYFCMYFERSLCADKTKTNGSDRLQSINQSINIRLIKVVRRNLKQLKYWQCIHSIK